MGYHLQGNWQSVYSHVFIYMQICMCLYAIYVVYLINKLARLKLLPGFICLLLCVFLIVVVVIATVFFIVLLLFLFFRLFFLFAV